MTAHVEYPPDMTSPITKAVAVTPGTPLDKPCRGLYIGDAAAVDVALTPLEGDSAITFTNMRPGTIYWIRTKSVAMTGTTATSILALY